MPLHFLLNSLVPGGAVKATAQQLTDTGLGDFWQDSSESFVTTAVAFDDRSYVVTEQTVGDASVAYYGQAIFNSTYTGTLIAGYHDTAATPVANVLLFSEVRYFRNGTEIDFTISQDRTNQPVGDPFVFKMSRRADGTVAAMNSIYVSDVDVVDFAFETEALVATGAVVALISNVAVSPSGQLGVVAVGPRDSRAVLITDGSQAAGITYSVTCDVLMSTGETIELNGRIVCVSTP